MSQASIRGMQQNNSQDGRGLTVSLIILCLSFQILSTGAIALFLPSIRQDLSLSFTQAGSIIAVTMLVYAMMQIPAGYLADRFNTKKIFFIGCIGTTALLVTFGLIGAYWQALSNQVLTGFFQGLLFTPGMILIIRWFGPERRATAMSLYLLGIYGGQVVLNAIGPVLATSFSWRLPFICFGIIGILASLAYFRFSRDTYTKNAGQQFTMSDFFSISKSSFMWLCSGIHFVRLAVFLGLISWIPTFLMVEKGLSLQITGFIVAAQFIFIAAGNMLGGHFSDRLRNPPIIIGISLVVLAITSALLVTVDNIVVVVLIIAINSIFVAAYTGSAFAMPMEVFGAHTRGTTTGFGNFFANLGGFAFTYLLGALKDLTGSFKVGFYAVAGACCIGLLFVILAALMRRTYLKQGS